MNAKLIAVVGIAIMGTISCGKNTPVNVVPPAPPPQPPPPPPPPPPPTGAGLLTVTLTSPNADDGALLLELHGPSIRDVVSTDTTLQVYADTTSTTTVRTVVAGKLSSGALLTFQVPDVAAAGSYTATIVDISDRQNRLRANVTGYTVAIGP